MTDKPFFARGLNVNNAIAANTTGIYVGANAVVANNTGVYVGANVQILNSGIFIGNSTSNTTGSLTSESFSNSTQTSVYGLSGANVGANVIINSTGIFIGNSTANTTGSLTSESFSNSLITSIYGLNGANVGANVFITPSTIQVGNSTVQISTNSTALNFTNPSGGSTLSPTSLTVGSNVSLNTIRLQIADVSGTFIANGGTFAVGANVTANTSAFAAGANVILSSTNLLVGNSTVNTTLSSTGIKYADGNIQNTAAFGKTMVWIPAGAMKSRATGGATANTYESTTNKINFDVFDFDASTNNHVQFFMRMPKSWNGSTVSAQFVWIQGATTTNFGSVWALSGVAFANASASDTAQGTIQQVTSTGAVNNSIYISPETAAITIGNSPASQALVNFEVKRVATDGADTMTVASKLLGVNLFITTNTTNDV